MRRMIPLICAVCVIGTMLCGCMQKTASELATDASEVMDKNYSNDNNGLLDDNRGSEAPTDKAEMTTAPTQEETISATEDATDGKLIGDGGEILNPEDGKVEDGDGNVGDMENNDGDGNIAPEDESETVDAFI